MSFSQAPFGAVVVAGPTASGKSLLAAHLARALGGSVVNADSQQVYGCFPLLAALPDPALQELAPHRGYGFLNPWEPCSVALWLQQVRTILATLPGGCVPVFVGGTGFYLQALMHGLPHMPDIDPGVQESLEQARKSGVDLWQRLRHLDPAGATRIHPNDTYRLMRALAFVESGGVPLSAAAPEPPCVSSCLVVLVQPPRQILRDRIRFRLERILPGALEEVSALGEAPDLWPAMKTLGARALRDVLCGKSSLEEAGTTILHRTCQYAKRQSTWFRHRVQPDVVLEGAGWGADPESTARNIVCKLNEFYYKKS
jgi:tRNA dimethylallyltransferase